MKLCEHCNQRRALRRYCSLECARLARVLPRFTLTCAYCAGPFETRDRRRVYCSHACYSVAIVGKPKSGKPGHIQRAILDHLRSVGGTWVEGIDLTRKVYGSSDILDRRALQIAMCRLRSAWEQHGLVIEYTRRGRNGGAYRLIRDIAEAVA